MPKGHSSIVLQVHAHDYRVELPKSTWLAMMRARFWSTFSHCTPEELEQASGCVAN